ncbi:hypothetical protein [Fodinicola acaciae]|uniref:hypothetical protein n=1 Tax=Fodinicola acaciae TaxID=2681555 RepID=UPI0013D00B4D|nr:hypothetical protein [Fodinicola acaciae]
MNVTKALVWLYPRPMRERWDIQADWRQLPDLLRGIADSWLHPAFWPATTPAQRRRRATAAAATMMFLAWLAGHAVLEQDPLLPATLTHAWQLSAIEVVALVGLATIAPLPRLTVATIRRAAARLVPPAGLAAVVVVVANSPHVPPGPVRGLVLIGWWFALLVGGLQVCRLVADVDGRTPGPLRLRLGLWAVLVAAGATAAAILGFAVTLRDPYAGVVGAGIAAVALVVLTTARDVRELA